MFNFKLLKNFKIYLFKALVNLNINVRGQLVYSNLKLLKIFGFDQSCKGLARKQCYYII